MKVFLTGAHSTGKTTLAKALSERLGLPLLPEVARRVLTEKGLTFPVPPDRVNEVQQAISIEQWRLFCDAPDSYISDRFFDSHAYSTIYGGKMFGIFPAPFETWFKDAFVFSLPVRRDLFVTDAIRGPSDYDDALRIDGALMMLYQMHGIPVRRIKSSSVRTRVEEVLAVIGGEVMANSESKAKRTLKHALAFPYDAGDEWWNGSGTKPPKPIDWAHAAALGVIADLSDRRGIKNTLGDLDEDIKKEIVQSLAAIIRVAKEE